MSAARLVSGSPASSSSTGSSCHRSSSNLSGPLRRRLPVLLQAAPRRAGRSLHMGSEVQQQHAAGVPAASADAAGEESSWSDYNQRWFQIWDEGLQKGQLLSSRELQLQGKRALVPGCGRGYDVVAFAAAGATLSVGLDICPDAIAAANSQRDEQLAGHPNAAQAAAATELSVGDFFSYNHSSGQLFDVGYDYTFLCALHPGMRASWAQGWARLLAPGGELLTWCFEQVLLQPIPAGLSHEGRQGREWLGRWRRRG
ncbi:S-adenosyl-L-methionine-dependent methyltransferase [Scenedesmus sp. NREL 46B-D3]|nr:S-adenosyl-L-methionine-dependent methyltransferase [Scenedesmus sp. NREL 46B-D3]